MGVAVALRRIRRPRRRRPRHRTRRGCRGGQARQPQRRGGSRIGAGRHARAGRGRVCAPRSARSARSSTRPTTTLWESPSGVPDLTLGEGVLAAVVRRLRARRRHPRRDRPSVGDRRRPRRAVSRTSPPSSTKRDSPGPRSRSETWIPTTSAAAAARSPATRSSSSSSRPAAPMPSTIGPRPEREHLRRVAASRLAPAARASCYRIR